MDETLSKYALEYTKIIPKKSFIKKFMFIFIPQLGYMLAVEKNSAYFNFINRISKKFTHIQENNNEEETSNLEEESINDVTINLSTSKKDTENLISSQTKDDKTNISENNYTKRSIYFSENEDEKDENFNNLNKDDDEEDEDEENFLNNFDETLLLQNICFKNINLKFQFHNETFIYYKNDITKILYETYGDLSARITDLENSIYREISKQILKYEKNLTNFSEFIGYLDCFLNFFLISEKLNLSRPEIKEDESSNSIEIVEGRNLIIEYLNITSYVKNDFKTNVNISIISGINSSGKSCFLRQVMYSLI